MRIIKLFKNHILALVCAVALIIVSCNADLTLPTYMSEIVDVGIQQGGIESAVPATIREQTLANLELFMSEEDAATVEAAYGEPDSEGVRAYVGTDEARSEEGELANIMSLPETVALALEQGFDASAAGAPIQGTVTMDDIRKAVSMGMLDRDQLVSGAESMADQMGSMGGVRGPGHQPIGRPELLPRVHDGKDVRPVRREPRRHDSHRRRGLAHRLYHRA